MRLLFLIAMILTFTRATGQNDTLRRQSTQNFTTAGKQEDNWAKELFENVYTKENFKRYSGKIVIVNDNTFGYGDNILKVYSTIEDLKNIFKFGIIHSTIIGGGAVVVKQNIDTMSKEQKVIYNFIRIDTLAISDVKELKFLNNSSVVKRFRFLLWRPGLANPMLYFFELTNDNADRKTELLDFIKGSRLTFFKMQSI